MLKRTLLLASVCVLIASCGWHLRGQDSGAIALSNVALTGEQGNAYLAARDMLKRRDALVPQSQAEITLDLSSERWSRRTVSVAGNALAAEYQLTLNVPYKITNADNQVLASDRLSVIRSYRYDQNDVAGKGREEALLKEEMAKEIARRLLSLVSYSRKPAT